MEAIKQEFRTLIIRYSELRDALMSYTMNYFDGMGYDIQGYRESFYEDDFSHLDDLRNQIQAFELILEGLSKRHYIFG